LKYESIKLLYVGFHKSHRDVTVSISTVVILLQRITCHAEWVCILFMTSHGQSSLPRFPSKVYHTYSNVVITAVKLNSS